MAIGQIREGEKPSVLGILMILSSVFVPLPIYAIQQQVFPDSLLPTSSIKECLDTSMQLIGDFGVIQDESYGSREEMVLIKDLVLGRIVRLAMAIDNLCKGDMNRFLTKDIEYLTVLIKHINMLYLTLVNQEDRNTIGACLLQSSQDQLVQLLTQRLTVAMIYSNATTPLLVPAITMPDAPICLTQLNDVTAASAGLLTIF